jgi:ribonuclease D
MVVPNIELPKSKKISMSDWSVAPLSEKQIQYAAADAFAVPVFRI